MKFKTHGIILSLFFALGLVFSFSIETSATHGDSTITAQEIAADPGNEQKMRDLLDRVVNYYEHVRAENMNDRAALIRGLTVFARDIRREGDYKHDDIYVIDITGRNVVTNHAGYPERIGYKFNPDASNSAIASTIQDLIGGSGVGMPHCEIYDQTRVACATKVEETITGSPVTNIVGLHHDIDDSAFVPPDCEGLSLGTTAKNVYDDPTDANLEAYVKDVIGAVQEDIKDITVDELAKLIGKDLSEAGLLDLTFLGNQDEQRKLDNKVKTRIQERLFCFGSEDKGFKHKNIYVFMMDADPAHSTVLFNGNSFDLNGGNLKLKDYSLEGNDKTIAGLFNRELAGGTSAYANYRWDDPLDMEDEIEKWFERDLVPGSSPKRSYIEVADLNKAAFEELVSLLESLGLSSPSTLLEASFPEEPYIFGSGVYPDEPNMPHMMDAVQDDMTEDDMTEDDMTEDDMTEDDMTEDDMTEDDMTEDDMTETVDAVSGGGCTITGTSNTSQGTLLNLFLMASVLFSVVFLRRRA